MKRMSVGQAAESQGPDAIFTDCMIAPSPAQGWGSALGGCLLGKSLIHSQRPVWWMAPNGNASSCQCHAPGEHWAYLSAERREELGCVLMDRLKNWSTVQLVRATVHLCFFVGLYFGCCLKKSWNIVVVFSLRGGAVYSCLSLVFFVRYLKTLHHYPLVQGSPTPFRYFPWCSVLF